MNTRKLRNAFYDISKEQLIMESHSMETKKRMLSYNLQGYVDADWGSNPNGRKSQSGYLFTICGGVISWASKKQSAVALSSTEAE